MNLKIKLVFSLVLFFSNNSYNAIAQNGTKSTAVPLDDSSSTNIGNITIGNPPQTFGVLFDTGSVEFWVYSSFYDSCDPISRAVLRKHSTYNHSASSSAKHPSLDTAEPQLLQYGSGWAFGFKTNDVVSIGGVETRKDFIEITKASRAKKKDGLMGLKYDPKRGNLITMLCDKIKGEHKFSFHLPRIKTGDDTNRGELMLCGENKSKYNGTLKYVKLHDHGIWKIPMERVQLKRTEGSSELSPHTVALVDTGANGILGPEENITKFFDLMKSQLIGNPGSRQVDCNSVHLLPNVTFRISGTDYTLTGQDYTGTTDDDDDDYGDSCKLLFRKKPTNYWTLGDIFFRKFYTVFDMKNHQIGFAQSN